MTQDEAFLADIIAHPEDDAPRLIYADWLDDHGKPAWAQFIRLRHELAGVVDDALRRTALVERERALLVALAGSGEKLPDVLLAAPRVRPGPSGPPLRFTNSIGMEFILIPAGRFLMGKPVPDKGLRAPSENEEEDWHNIDEACPQHEVTLTRPFYLGIHAVTWAQYERIMDDDPEESAREEAGCEESDDHPAHNLCWGEAQDYCEALSALPKEKQAGRTYRLPTEAEWEYACRADTTTRYWCGDKLKRKQATFKREGPTKVGSYPPNPFGLYDMHGNVVECCDDQLDSYRSASQVDPRTSILGGLVVFRGGSYETSAEECASAQRFGDYGSHFNPDLGFRVALSLASPTRRKRTSRKR